MLLIEKCKVHSYEAAYEIYEGTEKYVYDSMLKPFGIIHTDRKDATSDPSYHNLLQNLHKSIIGKKPIA